MKGYQFLKNDFFDLCATRKIYRIAMLLYIYLRGLYCRFQKPDFYWTDKVIRQHLGISQNTLIEARRHLQERGVLKFTSGSGRTSTQYTLLGTTLLPDLRGSKMKPLGYMSSEAERCKNRSPYNYSKQRIKNRVHDKPFQGMSEEDKDLLRSKGLIR